MALATTVAGRSAPMTAAMTIVQTLVARNEADIVDEQIRYHLDAGVDFVIATDHRSDDGTSEILHRYEREGHARVIRKEDEAYFQSAWVTDMARLAATEHGADWILHTDADEFWWPREGTLREVLEAVPPRFGVVRGVWRHFVLRPENGAPFYERMIVRRKPSGDSTDPYHAQLKVLHRADPNVVVSEGSHDAFGERLVLIREWFPFEVLHFGIRRRDQLAQKYLVARDAHRLAADSPPSQHLEATAALLERRSIDGVYRELLVDDEALERGLDEGTLAIDTRVRDALGGSGKRTPPTLADDVALAEEIDLLLETDAVRRLEARVDAFERRLARLRR